MPGDPVETPRGDRMRVAILGAGGVGGYYGGLLARRGHPVAMLARGANLDALRAHGIEVRTPAETFRAAVTAASDPQALGEVELAILAVKSYSLAEVVPAVRAVAAAGATILPLLNGVEVTDRLAAAGVPRANLLGGLSRISAVRIAPGIVERRSPFQAIVLGELAGGAPSARAERIAAILVDAGVDGAFVSSDITADLWRKFAFIATMAAVCGLARSPIGPVRTAPLGRLLIERAVGEVVALARSRGVKLDDDEEAKVSRVIDSMPEKMKPSFLVDLEAGGPTELDDLCGAVARLGRQSGLSTPVHDTAAAALGVAAAAGDARQAS